MSLRPTPIVALNRAIAIAERDGPERALEEIRSIETPERLTAYPFYNAAIGEMELRLGHLQTARDHFSVALAVARNPAESNFLKERIRACDQPEGSELDTDRLWESPILPLLSDIEGVDEHNESDAHMFSRPAKHQRWLALKNSFRDRFFRSLCSRELAQFEDQKCVTGSPKSCRETCRRVCSRMGLCGRSAGNARERRTKTGIRLISSWEEAFYHRRSGLPPWKCPMFNLWSISACNRRRSRLERHAGFCQRAL
jgi:hypothetical protein